MGILRRKMFFSWEILPVIADAQYQAQADYFNSLSAEFANKNHGELARLFRELTALKVAANKLVREDETAQSPMVYRSSSPFHQRVDKLVTHYAGHPAIFDQASKLPDDTESSGQPGWVKPATFAGGALALLLLGYSYIKGDR